MEEQLHSDIIADPPFRYAAFVSYRHVKLDRKWAVWIHSKMETYRVPKRLVAKGLPRRVGKMFRDEEELAASADLSASIDEALKAARFLIVICSSQTPKSQWVNEEVKRFRDMGRTKHVLAVLVEGEPEDAFPDALRGLEPLAADVRSVARKSPRAHKKIALLKLLAAVLEVKFDDLRQRDEERTRRRMMRTVSAAGVATAVFAGLSLFSAMQWYRAETELRESRAQSLANRAQSVLLESQRSEVNDWIDPQRAVLLALESLKTSHSAQADQVLRSAMAEIDNSLPKISVGWDEALVGFTLDGRSVAIESDSGMKLIDLESRSVRHPRPNETRLQTHGSLSTNEESPLVQDLSCARDEQVIAQHSTGSVCACQSESSDGFVHLRRGCDGPLFASLPHEWIVRSALFSPDGKWLLTITPHVGRDPSAASATALVGNTVRVWAVPQSRFALHWDIPEIFRSFRFRKPLIDRPWTEISFATEGDIEIFALSPETGWLAMKISSVSSVEESHYVLLWPLWPDVLRSEACRRLERNLSPTEWESFIPFKPYENTCPGLPILSE